MKDYDKPDEPFDEPDEAYCSICGGPLVLLGTLGLLDWFRCRNCGMEFSSERTKDIEAAEELSDAEHGHI